MAEMITEIRPYEQERDSWPEAGFEVVTTEQVITLAIDNYSQCCEDWGFLWSEDDFERFIGTELLGIEITDRNLTGKAEYDTSSGDFYGDVMFVNLNTSRGTLQFVAYNEHNGYYGHGAYVRSRQLAYEVTL